MSRKHVIRLSNVYAEVPVDDGYYSIETCAEVTVEDLLQDLSEDDESILFDYLSDNHKHNHSIPQMSFLENLKKIEDAYYRLTPEEEAAIEQIAKRF